MARYVQPHVTQFDGGAGQGEACVPASVANGIAASTGGARRPSSQTIHRLVPRSEETNPATPGWSMGDADNATGKMLGRIEGRSHELGLGADGSIYPASRSDLLIVFRPHK